MYWHHPGAYYGVLTPSRGVVNWTQAHQVHTTSRFIVTAGQSWTLATTVNVATQLLMVALSLYHVVVCLESKNVSVCPAIAAAPYIPL